MQGERPKKWRVSAKKLLLKAKILFDSGADVSFLAQSGCPLRWPFTMKSRKFRDQVCTNLIRYGWQGYERPLPELVAKIIHQRSSMFVDVGANTGFYSLLAVSAGADAVYAYEPISEIADMLRENAEASGFLNNLSIRTCALSADPGMSRVWIPKSTGFVETSASLDSSFRANSISRSIETDTFDNQLLTVLLEHGVSGARILVKIDVENCEHLVLRGMKRALALLRPLLILELLDGNPHRSELIDILRDADYERLRWDVIAEAVTHFRVPADHSNFLFVPKELYSEVLSLISQ